MAADDAGSEGSAGGDAVKPDHLALAGGCAIAAAPSRGALAIAAAAGVMLAARRPRRRATSPKQRVR